MTICVPKGLVGKLNAVYIIYRNNFVILLLFNVQDTYNHHSFILIHNEQFVDTVLFHGKTEICIRKASVNESEVPPLLIIRLEPVRFHQIT